jgi:predicted nucleic acid-binding protein
VTRVFLDSNVLFSAAYNPDSRLRELWKLTGIVLITSEYAAKETRDNIPDTGDRRRDLESLLSGVQLIPEGAREAANGDRAWDLPDADDVPILIAAIRARCEYLLTGDRHFAEFFGRRVEGVTVMKPTEFLRAWLDRDRGPRP